MRILLFTGKGGVGKTTVAAATALRAAARGHKTLVVSTDAAHSLGDAFAAPLGPEPAEVAAGVFAQQVESRCAFERGWPEVRGWLVEVLDAAGVGAVEAEELAVPPGAEELLALLAVREQAATGAFDVVVVDCAPTAETLRLLALPDVLGSYLDRLFPIDRLVARALRPMLSRVAGVPAPSGEVIGAVERLHHDLAAVRRLLTEPGVASVRLVLTPEAVVLAEARRTLTALSLFGYRVDGVVANRVFPAGTDPWVGGWAAAQAGRLAEADASFAPVPVRRAPYRAAEPVGVDALAAFATDLYADDDPLAGTDAGDAVTVERAAEGDGFVLTLALPFAVRDEVDLARSGDELVVTVGGYRRLLALPSALRRCVVRGAELRDGVLRVAFEPDPDLWMRS